MRPLIVLPTYQEAENIVEVLSRIRASVPAATVLVVDDGSPDGTADLAEAAAGELGGIHVLRRGVKAGLGDAYRAGFGWGIEQGYDVLVEMDADLSHDPGDLPALLAAVGDGADLAIGSRYVPGGSIPDWPWHRRWLSTLGNRYAGTVLRLDVADATSGFRAYKAAAAQSAVQGRRQADGYGFQIEMARRVARGGGSIVEVPISFTDRVRGTSKMSWRVILEALLLVTAWGARDVVRSVAANVRALFRRGERARTLRTSAALGILAVAGAVTTLVATRFGSDVSPDSTGYLSAANSLVHGHGLTTLGIPAPDTGQYNHDLLTASFQPHREMLRFFPPGYSILLAAFHWVFAVSLLGASRLINAAAMSVCILVVARIVASVRPVPRWLPIVAALVVFGATDVLELQVNVASDGVFLAFVLAGVLCLIRDIDSERRSSWLWLAAEVAALAAACVIRYAGVGIVLGAAIATLLFIKGSVRSRLTRACIVGSSIVPLLIWVVGSSPRSSEKPFATHVITTAQVRYGLTGVSQWLVPHSPRPVVTAVAVLLAVTALWIVLRRGAGVVADVLMLTAASYGIVVVLAISFFDAETVLEPRILVPIHILLVALVLCLLGPVIASLRPHTVLRSGLAFAVCATGGLALSRGGLWIHDRQPSADEFASPELNHSSLLARVRALPKAELIATNAPDLLSVDAGRSTIELPYTTNVHTEKVNPDEGQQLDELTKLLETRKGVVVWASEVNRSYLPTLDQLRAQMPLSIIASGPDGAIFQVGA